MSYYFAWTNLHYQAQSKEIVQGSSIEAHHPSGIQPVHHWLFSAHFNLRQCGLNIQPPQGTAARGRALKGWPCVPLLKRKRVCVARDRQPIDGLQYNQMFRWSFGTSCKIFMNEGWTFFFKLQGFLNRTTLLINQYAPSAMKSLWMEILLGMPRKMKQ